ncbi:hypothetical protein J3E69DRAFT_325692 [Trichoderma sp. SZMC 28015]
MRGRSLFVFRAVFVRVGSTWCYNVNSLSFSGVQFQMPSECRVASALSRPQALHRFRFLRCRCAEPGPQARSGATG